MLPREKELKKHVIIEGIKDHGRSFIQTNMGHGFLFVLMLRLLFRFDIFIYKVKKLVAYTAY